MISPGNAIVLAISSLLSFGCSNNTDYPVPTDQATSGSITFAARELNIASEKFRADYGTVIVPENRTAATTRLIHLPVLRIHSQSASPGEPVFGLNGGPGNSNMKWDLELIRSILDDRDIVLVGYRGVDGSVVLSCPEVKSVLKKRDDPLSEAFARELGDGWAAAGKRLRAEGVDLDHYTMIDVIDDMERVREALSYQKVDLLSRSYGTRLAYLYGLRYPGSIQRSAMLCVNPPGHFVWDAATVDQQLRYYSEVWSRDSATQRDSKNLYTSVMNVLANMPDHWLIFPINEQKVRILMFPMLFHRNSAAMVFDAFVAAERGDASGLALISLGYDFMIDDMMEWGDLASKGVSADFDSTANYMKELAPTKEFPLGSPLGQFLWGPLQYGHWPVRMINEEYRYLQKTDVETLLISGSVDFSTPASHATNELLPYLTRGQQIVLSECGHTADVLDPDIGHAVPLVQSFFNNGLQGIPERRAYVPMKFDVSVGFPGIMKFGLVVLVLIMGMTVWLALRVFRKLRM